MTLSQRPTDSLPDPFTAIGFDFGLRYIGVAKGSSITKTAQPLTCLTAQKGTPDWHEMDSLLSTWSPHIIVVGYPLNMDGSEQAITQSAKQFAQILHKRYALETVLCDERLSTIEAKQRLFDNLGKKGIKRDQINTYSAQIILEQWFRGL